jgi:hypothetical protein
MLSSQEVPQELQLQHLRCYFLRAGRIVGVEEMFGFSEYEAIEKGRILFETRRATADGFEIWDPDRVVMQHPKKIHPIDALMRKDWN